MLIGTLALGAALAFTPPDDYARLCSGCHGPSFRLPNGGTTSRPQAELVEIIRAGSPAKGMPAFGAQLDDARIEVLARFIGATAASGARKAGATIEAETLHPVNSASYVVVRDHIEHFSQRSSLCYEDVELDGVRSIELTYSKGNTDAGRFAIVIGDGLRTPRVNLGEKVAVPTGSWDRFAHQRVGLEREISGRHLLCFYGVDGGGILNLDRFTLSADPGAHDGITWTFEPPAESVITAAGYTFALERVAEAPSELWSMAFLPDGTLLATQKNGQLLVINAGRTERIAGVPPVWSGGQGGLLAVKPHPQYAKNGWIYLTFSDPGPGNATSMTRVVRGKLDGLRWVGQQDIYRAPDRFYTPDYAHFGSRIAFRDGYIYFSIGERQHPEQAPDLAYPYGKIHRLHDDGRIPRDNPFVGRQGALPSIWSYGHRNPQGMTAHPRTGVIWSCEHGPRGGDELNLVRRAADYGWPRVSFGTHYDETPVGPSPYLDGVEPPVHHWTPSIAVSQIEFYFGARFPEWNGQLLVASLGFEELRLVRLRDERVLNDQLLFKGHGRIRDVTVGPDGFPYVLLNGSGAGIYRLRPDAGIRTSP